MSCLVGEILFKIVLIQELFENVYFCKDQKDEYFDFAHPFKNHPTLLKMAKIAKEHKGVVARFGDKLWDVAHYDSLHNYLSHVCDSQCYVFFDPGLGGTFSGKLPGSE